MEHQSKHQTDPNRTTDGKFTKGNTACFKGWESLVQKKFAGNETLAKQWWIAKALYHSDLVYVGTSIQKFFDPGTPEEYLARLGVNPWSALDESLSFRLDDLQEISF